MLEDGNNVSVSTSGRSHSIMAHVTGAVNFAFRLLCSSTSVSPSRFGECMLPVQRSALDNLGRYKTIVLYDQATLNVASSQYSAIMFTLLKFHEGAKGRFPFLKGGFASV